MHYGKEEEWIERNLWVISLCSEWNLGAPEENLNEREIKVKENTPTREKQHHLLSQNIPLISGSAFTSPAQGRFKFSLPYS